MYSFMSLHFFGETLRRFSNCGSIFKVYLQVINLVDNCSAIFLAIFFGKKPWLCNFFLFSVVHFNKPIYQYPLEKQHHLNLPYVLGKLKALERQNAAFGII